MGRPNSSVRMMIGMMIIKEGQGWSDQQLFEECRFNLKVMRALGLTNINDDIPTESTYYEFRKILGAYNKEHEQDLLKETFCFITSKQVKEFKIGGKKIRMDSKLINSNIAKSTRLNLIVETVRKYMQEIEISGYEKDLEGHLWDMLKELQVKSTTNVTYPLNGQQKTKRLLEMGLLIKYLLEQTPNSSGPSYLILKRLYEEQYQEISNYDKDDKDLNQDTPEDNKAEPQPKAPKQISSGSIQSAHDTQASFRSKGRGVDKQEVSGFHCNITESCNHSDELNLILDVEVAAANVSENEFLTPGLDNSEKVLQQGHQTQEAQIEEVITDGGYDSLDNRKEMLKDSRPKWSMAKTKGGKSIYQIEQDAETKLVEVTHLPSNKTCEVSYSERAKKYVIQHRNGSKRYMTQEQISNHIGRQTLESQVDPASYNLRANAESTIHQTFHRLKKGNKIVYRGLQKSQWYVISRAFWVNLTRIVSKKALNSSIIAKMLLRFWMTHYIARNREIKLKINFFNKFQIQ